MRALPESVYHVWPLTFLLQANLYVGGCARKEHFGVRFKMNEGRVGFGSVPIGIKDPDA